MPLRIDSAKDGALCGAIMNSWKSTVLSACLPPLMTFMQGTGKTDAFSPPRYRKRGIPKAVAAEAIVQELHREIKAQGQPVISRVDYWEDADPLPPHLPNFKQKMDALKQMLPAGIGLVGSDYDGLGLAGRILAGQSAAQKIGAYLQS